MKRLQKLKQTNSTKKPTIRLGQTTKREEDDGRLRTVEVLQECNDSLLVQNKVVLNTCTLQQRIADSWYEIEEVANNRSFLTHVAVYR
jgi:hypothetical protein